jgi:hypothetical protein
MIHTQVCEQLVVRLPISVACVPFKEKSEFLLGETAALIGFVGQEKIIDETLQRLNCESATFS